MANDTQNDVALDPENSPDTLGKNGGVRRINNIPVILFLTIVASFLVIMALVAVKRGQQPEPIEGPIKKDPGGLALANAVTGDHADGGIVPPPKTPTISVPITGDDPPPLPPSAQLTPAPLGTPGLGQQPQDDRGQRLRAMRAQQFEEAVRSGSITILKRDRGQQNPTQQQQGSRSPLPSDNAYRVQQGQSSQAALLQQRQSSNFPSITVGTDRDRWHLLSQVENPRSAFEIRTGFVIPAKLITGINSDLAGQIIGQVSQNVFDTATGKQLLIPFGSKLIGIYNNEIAYGQARILFAWQRIVFPDGRAIDLGAMPGSDEAGFSGGSDQVNNHYARVFGSAFLLSMVTAGIGYSQRDTQQTSYGYQPSFSSQATSALGQQLGQVTAQVLAKNINIAPTLEIRPGFRLNVVVTKDVTLDRPYIPFDYQEGK